MAKDLIKVFNGNKRWKATDINISEAANISVAIASLKLENERFIADVMDLIKANLRSATNIDLINVTKSSFYMRKFESTKDLYAHIHAECVTRSNMRKFKEEEM